MVLKKSLFQGWQGVLVLFLTLGLCSCAPTKVVTAPSETPPTRPPVQVFVPPQKAPPSEISKLSPDDEAIQYERDIENYGAVLKKIPKTRRARDRCGKLYPIDLNLRNADLVEAVRVLADVLAVNYSIDPKVKGTVSVRATGQLSESELLAIMDTMLAVNGATMIRTDGHYKIVPADKASTLGMPVIGPGAVPAGMRTQVVFLEQTAAKEMADAIKPLVSPAGAISAISNNFIVLSDAPDNVDRLVNLITLLDSRGLAESSVKVIRVKNTSPGDIIKELETIFSSYGTFPKGDKAKFGVNFMPVERLNGVMIVASSRALMDRASYWVKQLDLQTDLLANVHVYNVENYKAKNLANLLTQAYGGTPSAATIKETRPASTTGAGTSGLGGGLGASSGLGGGRSGQMGTPMQTTSSTKGTGADMLSAAGEESALSGAAAAAGPLKERATSLDTAGGTSPKEGVRIIPDEENNLLVVMAPPHEWKIISRLLKQLDIIPRQVLNEVLIAEIRLTDDLKYGLEFLIGQTPTTSNQDTSGGSGALVAAKTIVPGTLSGVNIESPASAQFSAASGLTFVALDTANKLKGLINLLSSEGKVNILASPHIMAANNQEARIMIGEEVPILSSQSIPLVSQTTSFQTNTVQYRNTGIILTVRPQINAKGLVTLEIAQEVSNAAATTTGVSGSPTFTVRHAKTQLITGDNQTVVLGGLIREDLTETQAGIPGLRRMPLLGPLFGSTGVSRQKTELVVLITPHIVTNLQEGARVTNAMKERVGLQEHIRERRVTPPASTPREVPPPGY